ncbi:MAG: 16S rRNA (guanine(966)-N(2))-methyltransferase RsmD, partial [Rhodospirillaceae bacterium]|nr:16S rRNA (guanine(966)-N(2))-methyltransferase RsmD [Rhodospirillaceae bacterium]
SGLAFAVLPGLMAKGWANKDSLIVVEISKDEASTLPPGFELIDDRRYGVARFLLITPAENAF